MPQKPAGRGQFRGCRRTRRCFVKCRRSRRQAGRPTRRHPGRRRRHPWTDAEPDRSRGAGRKRRRPARENHRTRKQLIEASDRLHVAASRNQKIGGSPISHGGGRSTGESRQQTRVGGGPGNRVPACRVLEIPNEFAAAYNVACCVRCGSQDRASGRVSVCPRLHDFALSAFVLEFGAGN